MIQYRRSLQLDSSSSYIGCSHQDKNQRLSWHHSSHSLRSHGEHQVNTKSFRVLFTCRVCCHVHAALRFWGCGRFLHFIIKCILGIKHIFPCSFGDKRMHVYTVVEEQIKLLRMLTSMSLARNVTSPT